MFAYSAKKSPPPHTHTHTQAHTYTRENAGQIHSGLWQMGKQGQQSSAAPHLAFTHVQQISSKSQQPRSGELPPRVNIHLTSVSPSSPVFPRRQLSPPTITSPHLRGSMCMYVSDLIRLPAAGAGRAAIAGRHVQTTLLALNSKMDRVLACK